MQKADTEWNTARHIPPARPNSPQKAGIITKAPTSSKISVIFMIKPVRFTIPPTLWAEMASCIVLRCFKFIFFPDTIKTAAPTVTTPMPPIWISIKITACPNLVQ